MKGFLLLILGWVVIAFIYSKVKNVSFIHAMINVPAIILKVFFDMAASKSRVQARDLRRKKQYDDAEKMSAFGDAAENYSQKASSIKEAADRNFKKDE